MNKKTLTSIGIGVVILGGAFALENDNSYTDKGSLYEIKNGGTKVELFKEEPRVVVWNDEDKFSIKYLGLEANGERKPTTDEVEWKSDKEEVLAYPLEDSFETELILKEKPKHNSFVFEFSVYGYEHFNFIYQRNDTTTSYIITRKSNDEEVFRIPLPEATDAKGNQIQAHLNIMASILFIVVPQEFLDTAEYPVRVRLTVKD